jgi:thiol-disulfide isomerase/thioredoxin
MPAHPTLSLQIACLCAGWCGTCTAYRPLFRAAAAAHPEARFGWIDVEDQADALAEALGDAPEIDNFPTLLVLAAGRPVFYGPVLPQAALLERLLAQAALGGLAELREPQAIALGAAVAALLASAGA